MNESIGPLLPRLSTFHVEGLFGEFNHTIQLRLSERITAVIAPNGSGKTACLRLINALFRKQWHIFASTQFEYVEYKFSNGGYIRANRTGLMDEDDATSGAVTFSVAWPGAKEVVWLPRVGDEQRARLSQVERYLSFLTRVGTNRWAHDYTGQTLTITEIVQNYGDRLPASLRRGLYEDEPKILVDLAELIDCHLIETQRLLIISDDDRYERRSTSTLAISKKAQILKEVIASELTNYATLSQSLDRSFPRRVIENYKSSTEDDLRQAVAQIDEKRNQLMAAGILDNEGHDQMSLPDGSIDGAVARVLTIYATDTKQKLDSLSQLLARIGVFRSLIEERFKPKTLEVTKVHGFQIRNGKGHQVPLDKLSSGEQHQLVLYFELLFELKPNALILIDEPELSLHVSWQKKFIRDLRKIIQLNQFDVVLATHSPQLISRWPDLVVDLGEVDDEDRDEID